MGARSKIFFHWLLCSIVGTGSFLAMGRPDGIVLPFLVALALAFPDRRYGILFFTGLFAILIRWSFNRNGSLGFFGPEAPRIWGFYAFAAHIAIVGVFAKITELVVRRQSERARVVLLISIFLATFVFAYFSQLHIENKFIYSLVQAFSAQLGLLAPCIALTIMSLQSNNLSPSGVLASLSQGWMTGFILPPIGVVGNWDRVATKSFDETVRLQRRSLWLFVAAAAFGYLRVLYVPIIGEEEKTSLLMIQPALIALHSGKSLSALDLWRAVLTDFWIYFIWLMWTGLTAVATMRLAGFHVFRNTYRLYESKTFSEFFERYQYFYKELVFSIAFWPSFVRLRSIGLRWRVALSLFVSVGIYNTYLNLVFRWTKTVFLDFDGAAQKILTFSLNYLIYATMLAALIYPSMLRAVTGREPATTPIWWRVVKIVGIVCAFAAIRTFERSIPGEYLVNWRMFFGLFGLS